MFTNNYVHFQKLRFISTGYTDKESGFINTNGVSFTAYSLNIFRGDIGGHMRVARCRTITASISAETTPDDLYPGIYFGSGLTTPTVEDITLESPITSGLSITNPSSVVFSEENGIHVVSATYILKNISTEEITINEVGIFTPLCSESTSSVTINTKWNLVLMARNVLPNPVVIPVGETRVVTYKISFNQGENV